MDLNLFPDDLDSVGGISQNAPDEVGGKDVGKFCRQGDTGDIHFKDENEEEIEQDIEDPGKEHVDHGTLGITDGAENGTAEVVKNNKGHTGAVDPHVEGGFVDDVVGGIHQTEHGFGNKNPDNCHGNSPVDGDGGGGVDVAGDLSAVFCAGVAGNENVDTGTESEEDVEDKDGQTVGGTDGGEGFAGGELSDNDQISGMKEQLEKIGHHQGNSKKHDLAEKRTVTHIYLVFFAGTHKNSDTEGW